MIVDREFDQETVQQLKVVPIGELKAFLKARTISPESQTSSEPSRWAKFVEDTKEINLSDETYQHIQNCSKDFREELVFKHDLPK